MKNNGKKLIFLGLLLIAAALCLTAYNLYDGMRAERAANDAVKQLDAFSSETEPLDESIIPDYILNPDMEMPVKTINGMDYIGILRIPTLELELPIISEWSYPALKVAPCRYSGSAYQNNLILCGHNYASHFGNLKQLCQGDQLSFTDMDGNTFYFKVVELEILSPTAVEDMESGDWDLTLFTCTIGGQTRVTVRCVAEEFQ